MEVRQEIKIGEWCIFTVGKNLLVGQILGFSYINGKTYRTREYSRSFATIQSDTEKVVGTLCHYYSWNADGGLIDEPNYQFYLDVKNYKATISAPAYERNGLRLEVDLVIQINDFFERRGNYFYLFYIESCYVCVTEYFYR